MALKKTPNLCFKSMCMRKDKTNFQILVIKHVGAGGIFDGYKAILILIWRRGAHM